MGAPVKLKKEIFPHLFNCQLKHVNVISDVQRTAVQKLNRKQTLAKIWSEEDKKENSILNTNESSQQFTTETSQMCKDLNSGKRPFFSDVTNTVSFNLFCNI